MSHIGGFFLKCNCSSVGFFHWKIGDRLFCLALGQIQTKNKSSNFWKGANQKQVGLAIKTSQIKYFFM